MTTPQRFLVGTLSAEAPLWTAELLGDELTVHAVPLVAENVFSIATHPTLPLAYLVELTDAARLHVVRLDDAISPISVDSLAGIRGACRVRVDAGGHTLAVAGYASSSVFVGHLGDDGLVAADPRILAFDGHGPDPERQDAAHPHDVLMRGEELLVVDLGADRVHRVGIGDGTAHEPLVVPSGSGPRHVVTGRGDDLLVSGELDSAVHLIRAGGDVVSAPASARGGGERNYPSTLVHSERHSSVWVANRGANSIRRFRVSAPSRGAEADLIALDEVDSGAEWPEHLSLVGDRMLVAHSRGNTLTVLPVGTDGRLGDPVASAGVPQAVWVEPVCSNRGTALINSRV